MRRKHRSAAILGIVLTVLVTAVAMALIVVRGIRDPDASETPDADLAEVDLEEIDLEDIDTGDLQDLSVVVDENPWWGLYNLSLLNDGDPSNDFDFGWNAYDPNKSAEDYKQDHYSRMDVDPLCGVTAMSYTDVLIGTGFVGYVPEDPERDEWTKLMNERARYFMKHEDEYRVTISAFKAFLNTGTVSVTYSDDITDQMCMNPYTADGVSEIVVYESHQKGNFVTYNVPVKGTVAKISFRTECGYQPCNTAELMNVTPQSKPTTTSVAKPVVVAKPSGTTPSSNPSTPSVPSVPSVPTTPTPTPDTPVPTPTPTPDTPVPTPTPNQEPIPTPTPTPAPSPSPTPSPSPRPTAQPSVPTPTPTPKPTSDPKDTNNGTQGQLVGPNDNSGPGPDTNNGNGAWYSSQETPESSVHESYPEYRDDMDNLGSVNEDQRTGNDNNTPTAPAPTQVPGNNNPVNVDNSDPYSGTSQNPNGINNPTPESGLPTTPGGTSGGNTGGVNAGQNDSGGTIANNPNNAAESGWDDSGMDY